MRAGGDGMDSLHKRMHWLQIGSDVNKEIENGLERQFEERLQESEDKFVLIGPWYYYLYVHGKNIELHRSQQKIGQPSFTEVVKPRYFAISDEDLECAVNYWSCGTSEPGHYRISPLIERKLRILFE
jgi:hypothetical protein